MTTTPQSPTIPAISRVQSYLDRLEQARGHHNKTIHSFDCGAPSEATLYAADLQALVNRCSALETARDLAIVQLNGANERLQHMLQHKNIWRDRALVLVAEYRPLPPCDDPDAESSIAATYALRDHPTNPMNAARAGWEAAREHVATNRKLALTAHCGCWCAACDTAANGIIRTRMSLCPDCGDKRCARAESHHNECSSPAAGVEK